MAADRPFGPDVDYYYQDADYDHSYSGHFEVLDPGFFDPVFDPRTLVKPPLKQAVLLCHGG